MQLRVYTDAKVRKIVQKGIRGVNIGAPEDDNGRVRGMLAGGEAVIIPNHIMIQLHYKRV